MNEIDAAALHDLVVGDPGTTVVDVRETGEYLGGHVPGAVSLPLSELGGRADELASMRAPVYLVCESGDRSAQAAQWLAAQGYDVVNVAGGTSAWRRAGLPLE